MVNSISISKNASDYLLIHRASDQNVNVKFHGYFQQRPVVWDAVIRTMSDYYESEFKKLSSDAVTIKQLIDIRKEDDGFKIELVLNLKRIDASAIQKSIIMVRNYKRLSLGRHEYGEDCTFSNDAG